jgi:tRNA-specific 2-thiouridylase
MKRKKEKILVAMSGGVDSAVSALILKKQGYDVTGVFMINWHENKIGESGTCSWEKDQTDARIVAEKIGIKIFTWDFSEEYKKYVFEYFLSSYKNGITPNPDTLCNKYIKFGIFLDRAKSLGFDKIATGHYAEIKQRPHPNPLLRKERGILYELWAGRDSGKDQSYFLYELGQKELANTLFPIANIKKKKVRKLAKKYDLRVHDKKDSYGICYIGEKNMKDFLGGFLEKNPGKIIDKNGNILGSHEGLHNYTIGQRQGIGIGGNGPFFVMKKNIDNNSLIVTDNSNDPALFTEAVKLDKVNWISKVPENNFECLARFRHLQKLFKARVELIDNSNVKVIFDKPQRSVAPGQAVVFYEKSGFFVKDYRVVGGGIISIQ